jgi:hypothetical protein
MKPMIETTSSPTPKTQKDQSVLIQFVTRYLKFWPKNPVMKVSGRKIVAM